MKNKFLKFYGNLRCQQFCCQSLVVYADNSADYVHVDVFREQYTMAHLLIHQMAKVHHFYYCSGK